MKLSLVQLSPFALVLAILLVICANFPSTPRAFGSAESGLQSTLSTTTQYSVGSTSVVAIYQARANCAARIITTVQSPIMISFDALSSTTVSATVGHLQAASTTVAYDGGIYGCGLWSVYGYQANSAAPSTTITISETR